MMKKYLKIFLIFVFILEVLNAGKLWVFFTDKNTNTDNYISLTEKSILRRQKVNKDYTWYDRQISDDYIQAISETGATIHRQSKWLNAVSVTGTEEQMVMIRELSFVKKIQPVAVYKRKKEKLFTSSYAPKSFSIDSSFYGFAWEQIEQINGQTAHDAGYYGQGVRILLLDTGFNTELAVFDSLNIIDEWDFINNDGNTANETDIENAYGQHNHGTMVFSTMAGYDPGYLVGPAYGSEFLLAKTEDVTSESQVEEDNYVAALEWGEQNGADVASSSLGYLDWYSYCDMNGNTAVTSNAVDIAVNLGMVCVTAAGNGGYGEPPPNPCDTTLYYYIIAPADADSVIAVGAVNSSGIIASFSSHGPTYDGRIKPEVCARGVNTWCTNPNSNSYLRANGTSLATPLVGGAAAVILSANPDWTPMQVREAMMMTADNADYPDNDYGYGIIDIMAAIDYETNSIDDEFLPKDISILSVYPNPFNPTTIIRFNVETTHESQLRIYDINGRLVETLVDGIVNPGEYKIEWNASDVASGIYFLRLKTINSVYTKKITYLK
jgi:subtilisin family serine protease